MRCWQVLQSDSLMTQAADMHYVSALKAALLAAQGAAQHMLDHQEMSPAADGNETPLMPFREVDADLQTAMRYAAAIRTMPELQWQ